MHFIRFVFLVGFISASPTEQHDGTISYFNNNYRSNGQTEKSDDIGLYFRSHKTKPIHQAKIGRHGIESNICSTKRAAEKEAIWLYLMQRGGKAEVKRAQLYRGKLSLLLEEELNKQRATSTYRFGDFLPLEENQWLELKSCRKGAPNDTPPPAPFPHATLRKSIAQHLTKYAAAFLNAQCVYPHLKGTSTLIFGVHDDYCVDGFMTTADEKDQTIRQINDLLDLLLRQHFERSIVWHPVTTGGLDDDSNGVNEVQAYVVHVSVTPISPQIYCLESQSREYTFWMRRDNQCKKMTFEEMAIGFRNVRILEQ